MEIPQSKSTSIRVALEGCGHGCLHDIYASVEEAASLKGWDGVDLLVIGGDFQAVRNSNDLTCMSVPQKYKEIGDFHEYYSGQRTAPYLTIFIGGNHEASNHHFELYYGGWVAPNIYYMGAASVIRCGPLRIAGMSGIWKGYDYRKPHFERIPYNRDDIHSIYHIRELDIRKLLQIRTQVDLGLSHDWPSKVEYFGDYERLFQSKRGFRDDSLRNKLGSQAAKYVLDRLRPAYWFSAHLHVRFVASIQHGSSGMPDQTTAMGLAGTPKNDQSRPQSTPYSFGLDGAIVTYITGDEENQSTDTINDSPTGGAAIQPLKTAEQTQQIDADVSRTTNIENEYITQDAQDVTQQTETVKTELTPDEPKPTESRLSAWQNFHKVAAKNEADENSRFLSEQNKVSPVETQHNLTWRKIDIDEDGVGRKLTGVEKSGYTPEAKKQKTGHEALAVKNSDEIDLDLDSDSDAEKRPESPTPTTNTRTEVAELPKENVKDSKSNDADVSADIRSQLPASFSRPPPTAAPVYGPFPETISNKTTDFLALDKCLPNRDFLQLIEFNTVSDLGQAQCERPFRLQYDKEWLAITRVFAQDLQLGDPSAKPSADKGDAIYKPLIVEEEKWVEENVVIPGKLTVPDNFTPTAPFYDPAVPITTEDAPPEYNNPQTAAFCELVGIENKFHLSQEERQARMAAGPRPCEDNGNGMYRHNGPGRRGGFSGRGHGRGRGRGFGGRGRGRGGPRR